MTANNTSGNPAIISTNPTVEVAGTSASLANSFSNLAETGDYFRVRLYDTDKPFAIITSRLGRETGDTIVRDTADHLAEGFLVGKPIRDIMSSLDDFHRVLSKEVMVVKSPVSPEP